MTDEPKRLAFLSKDTLVPYGAAVAFAGLAWYGANQFGSLQLTIQSTATQAAKDTSDQAHALELQIMSLRSTVDIQGRDLAEVKRSVENLTHGSSK